MNMPAIMQFHFREDWRELRRGRPGHRFQARYRRARQEQHRCGPGQRILLVALAVVFLAIAVVLVVMPGPAFVFFILAGALLASESQVIARFMDWSEVVVRKALAWGKRIWRRLPLMARVLVIAVAVACTGAATYLGYQFLRA